MSVAGFLLLERTMLVLIIAELACGLRAVLQSRGIAPEPFLFIGLIATVRRILIVTAAFELPLFATPSPTPSAARQPRFVPHIRGSPFWPSNSCSDEELISIRSTVTEAHL
ncbi:MAG: phosphate-starvation-inducible PsiE family protein [Mycobacteriaceae bacterium]